MTGSRAPEEGIEVPTPDKGLVPDIPSAPGTPKWRTGLGLLARLSLTVLVTWFIVRAVGLNLGELRGFDLSQIHPQWGLVLLSCGVLLLGYLYSASLWGLLVKELGGPEIGTRAAWRVFFTANLGRYLPGKVWQLAGLALLARREGVPAGTATAAALLGQAFSLAGVTIFSTYVPQEIVADGNPCPSLGDSRVYVVTTTASNTLLTDDLNNGVRYFEISGGFLSPPFAETAQTKNRIDGDDEPTADDLPEDMVAVMGEIKKLLPTNCKFANYSINLKAVRDDTGIEFLAAIPICSVETNWKDF